MKTIQILSETNAVLVRMFCPLSR